SGRTKVESKSKHSPGRRKLPIVTSGGRTVLRPAGASVGSTTIGRWKRSGCEETFELSWTSMWMAAAASSACLGSAPMDVHQLRERLGVGLAGGLLDLVQAEVVALKLLDR